MFKTIKAIYEANGNKIVSGDVNKFVKDNNVAMLALTNINPFFFNLDTPENRAFNWGVTYQPGLGSIPYVQGIFPVSFLSSTSKNKELVVEIMKYMALDDSAVAEAMKRFEPLEKTGKNLEPLYGKNYVPSNYIATRYTTEELKLSQKYVQDLYKGKDVNTILRQLDEELKSLAQKMKK
jgi:AAA+ ATPase superfamily predicted ATPase